MPVCPKGIRTHYIFKYIPLSSPQPFSHHRHTPKTLPNATRTSLHTLIQHHSSSHIQGHTHVPLMWKDLHIWKPTPWTTNKGCGLDFSSAQPARPAPSGPNTSWEAGSPPSASSSFVHSFKNTRAWMMCPPGCGTYQLERSTLMNLKNSIFLHKLSAVPSAAVPCMW